MDNIPVSSMTVPPSIQANQALAGRSVLERLQCLLTCHGVPHTLSTHRAVYTSAEAAAVRGVTLASGAKALVCKVGTDWLMLVLPANRKLSTRLVRTALGQKRLRFATTDEVMAMTGLEPGSIPPFGQLFGLRTVCDEALALEANINFNAGDHSVSIAMAFADYANVETPQMASFSEPL